MDIDEKDLESVNKCSQRFNKYVEMWAWQVVRISKFWQNKINYNFIQKKKVLKELLDVLCMFVFEMTKDGAFWILQQGMKLIHEFKFVISLFYRFIC